MSKCTNCDAELAKDFHEKCQPCNRAYLSGRNEALTKAKALLGKAAEIEQERILGLLEDYDFSAIWRQVAWSPDAWESFGSDDLIALIKGKGK
jgi:hypothetical protein